MHKPHRPHGPHWSHWSRLVTHLAYLVRFSYIRFLLVGCLNATLDFCVFNLLLFIFPTQNATFLLLFTVISYSIGAINSFLLNKFWTFKQRHTSMHTQILRFIALTLLNICTNGLILWLLAQLLRPFINNAFLWADSAKLGAFLFSSLLSFLGMRYWVFFTHPAQPATPATHIAGASLATTPSFQPILHTLPEQRDTHSLYHPFSEEEIVL